MNAPNNRIAGRCKAFTLLELLIVLALCAMLAGAVVVSLRGPYQAARLQNTVERIIAADRQVRSHAQRYHRSAQIVIHLDRGTFTSVEATNDATQFPPFQVDSAARMDQLLIGDRRIDCGETAVAISPRGQSPTYAIRFQNPQGDHRWLVFLGITGQSIVTNDEQEIDELSRLSAAWRPDPN